MNLKIIGMASRQSNIIKLISYITRQDILSGDKLWDFLSNVRKTCLFSAAITACCTAHVLWMGTERETRHFKRRFLNAFKNILNATKTASLSRTWFTLCKCHWNFIQTFLICRFTVLICGVFIKHRVLSRNKRQRQGKMEVQIHISFDNKNLYTYQHTCSLKK